MYREALARDLRVIVVERCLLSSLTLSQDRFLIRSNVMAFAPGARWVVVYARNV
jgi:hypothetical protein